MSSLKLSLVSNRRHRGPPSDNNKSSEDKVETIIEISALTDPITSQELQFLAAVTGVTVDNHERLSQQQESWLKYVRQQILQYPSTELRALLAKGKRSDGSYTTDTLTAECFSLLTRLAKIIVEVHSLSIDKAVQLLSDPNNRQLCNEARQPELKNRARSFIFCCISWMTMLYTTSFKPDIDHLYLDHVQYLPNVVDFQPSENADRPISEFLQDFGPLLPVKDDPIMANVADPSFSADSIYVSLLNAATLSQLGGIHIEWIENISSHLQFDPETRKLLLFRLPSFCDVHRHKSVGLSKILSDYYDEFNGPKDFTYNSLLKEIRQSYQLIFADSSSSRRLYTHKELRRLRESGFMDPYLNQLCGVSSRGNTARNSYSMTTDFPILATRLSVVQDYILRQNPNTLLMIWRDKRNSYQWWTLWAVVVLGGLSLLFSLIQTALSAAQLYYTMNPSSP